MSIFEKFLTKEANSLARSVLQSNAKKGIKSLFARFRTKSQAEINIEIKSSLGYLTSHYIINKEQEIVFKPSVIFIREWLMNSPKVAHKVIKDEETGIIYFNDIKMTEKMKFELIDEFIKDTGTKTTNAIHSHFDSAFKLMDVSDFTSKKFKECFGGWDTSNTSIINNFLPNLFGEALESDKDYANFLFRKWVIGTARRALSPGVSFDGCLVLSGPGGVGKTSMFRELLPEPINQRSGEILCDIKNPQKFVEGIVGKTIVCFDELSVINSNKVQETFKQLLSSKFIDVRMPWRKMPERFLLRCGFAATTNKNKFIKDISLSRRLWTISLNNKSRINFDYLNSVKKDLWKEAVYLANNNENYLLSISEQALVEKNNNQFLI